MTKSLLEISIKISLSLWNATFVCGIVYMIFFLCSEQLLGIEVTWTVNVYDVHHVRSLTPLYIYAHMYVSKSKREDKVNVIPKRFPHLTLQAWVDPVLIQNLSCYSHRHWPLHLVIEKTWLLFKLIEKRRYDDAMRSLT